MSQLYKVNFNVVKDGKRGYELLTIANNINDAKEIAKNIFHKEVNAESSLFHTTVHIISNLRCVPDLPNKLNVLKETRYNELECQNDDVTAFVAEYLDNVSSIEQELLNERELSGHIKYKDMLGVINGGLLEKTFYKFDRSYWDYDITELIDMLDNKKDDKNVYRGPVSGKLFRPNEQIEYIISDFENKYGKKTNKTVKESKNADKQIEEDLEK